MYWVITYCTALPIRAMGRTEIWSKLQAVVNYFLSGGKSIFFAVLVKIFHSLCPTKRQYFILGLAKKKSLDILKLVIAQRELAWQWDLFDFRILQDCKVCCAVLNHRLVGCIVQHILREELTKLLPSKTPPCNARNPRSSSQRLFLFILISTCCT